MLGSSTYYSNNKSIEYKLNQNKHNHIIQNIIILFISSL